MTSLASISTAAGDFLESGDPLRALPLYIKAVSMARAAGMQEELSSLLGDMAVAYRRLGDVPAAVETGRQAIAAARACGHDLNIARWSGNLGGLLRSIDDLAGAEAAFREAAEAAERTGLPEQMALAAANLAVLLAEAGRFSEARDTMSRARELAAADPALASIVHEQALTLSVRWAQALRDEGRPREAREAIAYGLALAPGAPHTTMEVTLLMLLAVITESEGDLVSASEAIDRAADVSEAIGDHEAAAQLRALARRMRG